MQKIGIAQGLNKPTTGKHKEQRQKRRWYA